MARVLFFSDLHYSRNSSFEDKRWFPEIVSLLRLISDKLALRFLRVCEERYKPGISKILTLARTEKYNLAICLGDLTTGTIESGLISGNTKLEAREIGKKLNSALNCKLKIVLGNHDLGYKGAIGYKKGNISKESIDNALKIYSTKLFYSFSFSGKNFIVINSSLLSCGKEFESLKKEQFSFLKKILAKNSNNFILLHNPFSLYDSKLQEILKNNYKKIEAIVYGHAHSRFIGKLDVLFSPFYEKAVPLYSIDKGYSELIVKNYKVEWKHVHW